MLLNAKQVRAFFGLVGYYHKFIKKFAHIAKPLTALTCHDAKFFLTSTLLTAFNTLKSALLKATILHYPDPSKDFIVYTDTSDDTSGAQLFHEHDGQEFQLHSSCPSLQTSNRNGAPWNKMPMVFTMQ